MRGHLSLCKVWKQRSHFDNCIHLQRGGGKRGAKDDRQVEQGGVGRHDDRTRRGKYYFAALGKVLVDLALGLVISGGRRVEIFSAFRCHDLFSLVDFINFFRQRRPSHRAKEACR